MWNHHWIVECIKARHVDAYRSLSASKHRRSQNEPVLGSSRTAAVKKGDRVKHKSSSPIEKAESASPKEQKSPAKISSSMKRHHRDSAESLSSNKHRAKSPEATEQKLLQKRGQNTPSSPSTENKRNQTSSPSRKGPQHQRLSGSCSDLQQRCLF